MDPIVPVDVAGLYDLETLWTILKWLFVLAFFMYVLFALVVLAQIRQMVAALRRQFNVVLVAIGWANLLLAIGLFFVALVVL